MARLLFAGALGLYASAQAQTIELDMYRAMGGGDAGRFNEENDDLADLIGVLKYVHTETIAEHTMSPPTRTQRKNGIDVLARWRWKVQNTQDLVTSGDMSYVDFGPFLAFDYGQATAEIGDEIVRKSGDFVGIQLQYGDARFPIDTPFYWFAVTGRCLNLPWTCTRGHVDPVTQQVCSHGIPPSARCPESSPCPGKGTEKNPSSQCVKYDGTDKYARGGLCANFQDPDFTGPTGERGCAYSYVKDQLTKVSVDELVGIHDMDCGDRKCKNWLDFRQSCTDQSLQRQFDPIRKEIITVSFCVEYDIHPDCVDDCNAAKCKSVPKEQRELGLPFWQGRCEVKRNNERVEKLSAMFNIAGAESSHNLVAPDLKKKMQPCVVPGRSPVCSPDSKSGGPYCSRMWSGVCTPCYIPGSVMPYPANMTQPTCPVDILSTEDYGYGGANQFMRVQCKSRKPRDLCCIYTNDCSTGMDPDKAELDDDGLALAAAKSSREGSSQALVVFYKRLASKAGFGTHVKDNAGLEKLAYWNWQLGLKPGNITAVQAQLSPFFSAHNIPDSPSGGNSVIIIVAAVVVALVLFFASVAWVVMKRKQTQARAALLDASNNA